MKKISLFITVIIVNFFLLSLALDNGSTDYWEILDKVKSEI